MSAMFPNRAEFEGHFGCDKSGSAPQSIVESCPT
jgi:hypothetical protein